MPRIRFIAMSTEIARAYQAGTADANGQVPEVHISDGSGNPCRHCLTEVAKYDPLLIFAYRPFPNRQPYAETGPVFLHGNGCERYDEGAGIPAMFLDRPQLLIRGYGEDDRIVYGTGQIVSTDRLEDAAKELLERPDVAYVHARSASDNCYQCRIERA